MASPPRLRHLPGDTLGVSERAQTLFAQQAPWQGGALFLPRRLGDFDLGQSENTATIKSESAFIGDALDPQERAILMERLRAAVAPYTPHVNVLDAVSAAQETQATFVVTRVDPRLLGPNLEDSFGVLQAIRLSRELSGFGKRPVLPLAWVSEDQPATLDRCSARLLGPHHDLLKLSAFQEQSTGRQERIAEFAPEPGRACLLRAQLRQWIEGAPHRDTTLSLLLPEEGETLGARTRRILLELFGAHGLLVSGPDDFREDLAHELSWIVDRGRAPLAELAEDTVVCVDHEDGRALVRGGDGYCKPGEPGSRTGAELAAEIVQAPERFHAGSEIEPALLRRVFPVRAWLGDRREVEREHSLANLNEVERGRIAWMPRWQATWLEPRDAQALERLNQNLNDYVPPKNTNSNVNTTHLKSRVDQELAEPRASLRRLLREFGESAQDLIALDPSLAPLLRRQTRQAEQGLETFLTRAERVLRNRGGTRERHQRRLANALNPGGRHSSEVFGLLRPLAQYGADVLQALAGEIETFTFEHVLIFND